MAVKSRKVSFYRLVLEKHELIPGKRKNQIKAIDNDTMEQYFKEIYNNEMNKLKGGSKAVNVETDTSNYVIEVIEYEDSKAFLKIGQQNASYVVALRDTATLESEKVPMKESQLLELFTFCLIDFKTGIVSYIGINGAPRIKSYSINTWLKKKEYLQI